MNAMVNFLGDSTGAAGSHLALGVFILFCRIGGCLMLAPGFSSAQIPTQVRLFVALAATLALTPLLIGGLPLQSLSDDPIPALKTIGTELLIGGSIGLMARIFMIALETLATASATG